ncbi:MAG: hypothetical protein CVU31_13535 [Betaproteobacteria bacterium HGW-Betaproteobacteria-4]|jgi:hypothetical protein|nr:MAG: hypothetical protein CVU31_13535 [Betaproteobacteria bacterium HGW-Betaproteobacteria-4]
MPFATVNRKKRPKTKSVFRRTPARLSALPLAIAMAGSHAFQINDSVGICRPSIVLAKSILTP